MKYLNNVPEVDFLETIEPFVPSVVNSRQMVVLPVDNLKIKLVFCNKLLSEIKYFLSRNNLSLKSFQ